MHIQYVLDPPLIQTLRNQKTHQGSVSGDAGRRNLTTLRNERGRYVVREGNNTPSRPPSNEPIRELYGR